MKKAKYLLVMLWIATTINQHLPDTISLHYLLQGKENDGKKRKKDVTLFALF